MGVFSSSKLKFWQGIVEVILRAICIVLVTITFICSIAAASALSAEKTRISFIEDLRFDTRSPVGWILLLNIVALPLLIVLLVVRFLDVRFINMHHKIFLIIDIIISTALTVGYFGGAIPMAVHAGDWRFWRGQGSEEDVRTYNLNNIVSSVEATAAFSFLTTGSLVAVVVWLVLFLVLGWGRTEQNYKQDYQPKVEMVTSDNDHEVSFS